MRASRALLPGWLERGRGTFVVTASAAGLLTMLGAAPYSVTKHAAAAYAEWLAATYAHRGLTVHCICPQGVRTDMLAGSGRAGEVVLKDTAIEPEQVADALWDAMAEGRFLVLPHPEVRDYYAAARREHGQVAARHVPAAAADRGGRGEGLATEPVRRAAGRPGAGRGAAARHRVPGSSWCGCSRPRRTSPTC